MTEERVSPLRQRMIEDMRIMIPYCSVALLRRSRPSPLTC
jgi:hypothetical protein